MTTWTPQPKEIARLTDRRLEVLTSRSWTKYQLRTWLQRVHDGPLLHPGEHPFKDTAFGK